VDIDFLVPVHIAISVKKNCSCDTKTESIILGTQRPKYRFACLTNSVIIHASRIKVTLHYYPVFNWVPMCGRMHQPILSTVMRYAVVVRTSNFPKLLIPTAHVGPHAAVGSLLRNEVTTLLQW